MFDNYEINDATLAITTLSNGKTQIYEDQEIFTINKTANEIINYSCKYYGSSYKGRIEGTKAMMGYNYKLPIIIDEIREIIFFPTTSPRLQNCFWISLNKIKKIEKLENKTKIIFENSVDLIVDVSYRSLENQIMRSTLLENALKRRK